MLAAVAACLAAAVFAGPAHADSVPYTDSKATGIIGLCNEDLKPITSGSLSSAPFVWLAVGSTAAKGQWAAAGHSATLYAYQPRPNVPAGEWSGEQLTASARYTNTAHPMAQATHADLSLADFVSTYPPKVDGLIELRLYLGGPNLPIYSGYDATDIRVSGSSWSVVKGGTVDCTAGTSVSIETVVLPSSVVNPPPTHTATSPAPASSHASSSTTTAANAEPSGTSATDVRPVASQAADHGAHSASPWIWILVAGAVVALVAGALEARRRWR